MPVMRHHILGCLVTFVCMYMREGEGEGRARDTGGAGEGEGRESFTISEEGS